MDFLAIRTDDEHLEHYGVLGMKWGVRRDRAGTASKVTAQLNKDRSRAESLRSQAYKTDRAMLAGSKTAKQAKYLSKMAKYEKKTAKALRKAGSSNPKASDRAAKYSSKVSKYQRKAQGYTTSVARAAKLNAKAAKLEHRANKLEKAYDKQISKIDAKLAKKGEVSVNNVLSQSEAKANLGKEMNDHISRMSSVTGNSPTYTYDKYGRVVSVKF